MVAGRTANWARGGLAKRGSISRDFLPRAPPAAAPLASPRLAALRYLSMPTAPASRCSLATHARTHRSMPNGGSWRAMAGGLLAGWVRGAA